VGLGSAYGMTSPAKGLGESRIKILDKVACIIIIYWINRIDFVGNLETMNIFWGKERTDSFFSRIKSMIYPGDLLYST